MCDRYRTANDNPKLLEPFVAPPTALAPPAKPSRAARTKKDDGQGALF